MTMTPSVQRSEAAKKAWRTRRRLAKPTPTMLTLLRFLAARPENRVCWHYVGRMAYCVGVAAVNDDGSESSTWGAYPPRRLTRSTVRAMEKRGWLTFTRRRDHGGTMGTFSDGTRGIVEPAYSLDYAISDKGRAAVAKANG